MRMIASFEKTDRVRHIGHLDLMRAVQRALRRSGLPIRYSQGFNPHVVLAFASPLPVGVSGLEELMEVAMEADCPADEFAIRLAPAMPASLPLLSARAVDDRHPKLMAALRTAGYEVTLPHTDDARALTENIAPLLARPDIWAVRKTKSGEKPCDIRPMLHELSALPGEGDVRLAMRVSLTEKDTLKPDLLLRALADQAGVSVPEARVRRVRLFGEKDGQPIPLMEL